MTNYRIKKSDIIHNYRLISEHTHALVIPMLKANGYGLGAQMLLETLEGEGVHIFAVSRIEEAAALHTDSKLLVLSCYHAEKEIEQILTNGWSIAADSLGLCRRISEIAGRLGVTANVHFAVDTGFGRFGFSPDRIDAIVEGAGLPNIAAEGIFSHLSAAFFLKDDSADKQLERFLKVINDVKEQGVSFGMQHIANSSATLRDEKFHLDAVRIGSALCGRVPMPTTLDLHKVGELYSDIIDIRTVPKGQNIGYGNVYKVKRDTKVAVLAVGSADGVGLTKEYDAFRFRDFLRYGFQIFKMMLRKDNRKRVQINGKSVPVIGRVALTHTFVDVTDIECKAGDAVKIPISPLHVAANVERCYEE